MRLATHSQKLERYLGTEAIEKLSLSMKDWYGPPIPVGGVPGNVWAYRGGDFRGAIRAGAFASACDSIETRIKRAWRRRDDILHVWARRQFSQVNAGFSSLSDLIAEATAGKRRDFPFNKAGPTGVLSGASSLWRPGPSPAAGAAGSAAPGGRATTSATTGAFPFTNPTGGDTQHFVAAFPLANVASNTLLLYDRLFDVAKTMASTATEAVTGVPTRYTSQTSSDPDYIGGNFLFVEVGATQLAGTAHNWTTCLYTDQGGASSTLPSLTGNAGAIVDRLDHPLNQWYAPLETGDVGVKALTQMQCSASVATGLINFVIGHPIAWMPVPINNLCCVVDGINTAFALARIFDSACLSFLEVMKPSTNATTYTGTFTTVAG